MHADEAGPGVGLDEKSVEMLATPGTKPVTISE